MTECRRLAHFCNLQATDKQSDTNSFDEFGIVYDIFEGRAPVRKPGIARGVQNSNEDGDSNKLLFFSGYPSLRLLVQQGSHFNIDPEFFDLHLSFVKESVTSCNMHPSYYTLPSAQCNIFQTSITSIGAATVRDRRFRDLVEKRDAFKKSMDSYLSDLKMGKGWKTYHSIVRQMEVHDDTRFSLEQNLTIFIKRSRSDFKKWRIAVWLDVGADLTQSPVGPWLHGINNTHFRPVTLNTSENHVHEQSSIDFGERNRATGLFQSASLLSKNYGMSLDTTAMSDPLHVLSELFIFIATSECQYLDMIRAVLDDNTTSKQLNENQDKSEVRSILIFSYRGLEHRRDKIKATIGFLKSQLAELQAAEDTTVSRVLRDFEYLFGQTDDLMRRCDHEWNAIISGAAVNDAQWSRDHNEYQKKLTLLATIYIPLSFSCSLFGMTFFSLDSLREGFILWLVVTLSLYIVIFLAQFANAKMLPSRMKRLIERSAADP
ncbi:MAG: hypothetical protein Q9214_001744 [Letrouitia sp. 1 TL-2023]